MNRQKLKYFAPYIIILILSISILYSIVEIVSLNDRLSLKKSASWINQEITVNPNTEMDFTFNPSYAGYVIVNLYNHTPADVNVTVKYRMIGWDVNHIYGTNGYGEFPILPVKTEIAVINHNANQSTTVFLNVTYIY